MTDMKPLLIELGTEELPVKALPGLAQALFDGVIDGLRARGIAFERDAAKPLYSPRRLAVLLPGVASEQPEQRAEVFGPYLNIALDADGQPTRALLGFAAKAGVDWTALDKTSDNKGERFVHRQVKPGARTAQLLPQIIVGAVTAMPIPRPMRWGDHDHAFARPLHWLVVLLGGDVVEAELFGIRSDRMSRGHRFMHDKPVWLGAPDDYVESLRAAKVLVDADARRARIVHEVETAARTSGGVARIDAGILEQVNGLTEWPKAVACNFDRGFLAVPHEALIAAMETHQKFFPVLDREGGLSEHFVGIANIESRDPDQIRKGYQRVIEPRFADTQFFFNEDRKQGLASMNDGLQSVTYQAKLGSVADKVERVATLAEVIAAQVGADPQLARRAAQLSKADLQSRLVGEFPELQGIAGRYYATAANEPLEVARAIDEAYLPRFAGDAIAPSTLGQVLAIAERLDTLAGGFFAGLKPTGSKDAFALRRVALGLARTIVESGTEVDIDHLLAKALVPLLPTAPGNAVHSRTNELAGRVLSLDEFLGCPESEIAQAQIEQEFAIPEAGKLGLYDFILDRLRGYYAEQGVTPQQFEAVLATTRGETATPSSSFPRRREPMDVESVKARSMDPRLRGDDGQERTAGAGSLLDFDRRLKAVVEFAKLPEAEALAAANKRSRNILRKVDGQLPTAIDPALLTQDAERELADAVDAAIADTDPLLAERDYVAVLGRLARLRPPVDRFFDEVMVNADDAAVRNNRLALLKRLSDRLGSVAAIEQLSA